MEVPEYFNFGFDVVDKWAEDRTKLALISLDPSGEHSRQHTFWDLKVQSNRFANVLKDLGVTKGARVFLMLPRIPEWYVAMLGLMKLGAVPMPATTLCTPSDIVYRVNEAEAYLAITDSENSGKLAEAAGSCSSLQRLMVVDGERRGWTSYEQAMVSASATLEGVEPTRSDDPLLIYFTSGTVGYPKMVLHTQASYGLGHTLTAKYWHDLQPTDLQWDLVGHRMGQSGLRQAVRAMDAGRGGVAARRQGPVRCRPNPGNPGTVRGNLLLRATHGISDDGPGGPYQVRLDQPEALHRGGRTAESRGDEEVGGRHRHDHLRRVRADRDRADGRQLPLPAGQAGVHGQAHARDSALP